MAFPAGLSPGASWCYAGPMLVWMLITAAGLGIVLASEFAGLAWPQWIAKPVASLGFVAGGWMAWNQGGRPEWGPWVLAGLVLSLAGDVLLIPRKTTKAFLLGLAAFLLAHLAFALAFLARGLADPMALWAAVPLSVLAVGVLRWLWPRLDGRFRIAVPLYVAVISVMLLLAFAATLPTGRPVEIWLGALLFYLSDLFVARNRFVTPGFANRAIGLPLYYAGVWLLAVAAGLPAA